MSIQYFRKAKFPNFFSKYAILFLLIFSVGILIRAYFFPWNIPLNADALYYFWYSSDIYHLGNLPENWSPVNNGWPIFVSIFFTISDSKDIFTLMEIQRLLSTTISILISIPVYFLCKKFVSNKFSLIGAALIIFEPRLMINSFLGVTDSLYILLFTISLVFFLSSNKKIVYFSFLVVALCTIVRGEGIIFFFILSIMFFIRYRNEKYKIFLKYLLVLGIFMSLIIPVSLYRINANDNDGIFIRSLDSGNNIILELTSDGDPINFILSSIGLLIKYLGWIMIPNFIIFIPLGLFLIFKNRNFEKNTIIITLSFMLIPAFYAYMIPALETRYLYVLLPLFSILSALSIEKLYDKFNKKKIFLLIIIIGIISASMIFYNEQKIDYEHEREVFKIMEKVSPMIQVTNILYQESSYFKTIQTIEQWPNTSMGLNLKDGFGIQTLSTKNFNSIIKYIKEHEGKGLTHIIIDDDDEREDFLKEVFFNEDNHPYLKKIFDSKNNGFRYHLKVFEIDFERFDKGFR